MRIIYHLFFCIVPVYTLIGADINTPAHTMQHHEQVLDTSSITLSEQMINLIHEPMVESPYSNTDNLDLNYISNIIPHFQGAIDASEFLLKYAKNKKIRALAQEIINVREEEIISYKTLLPELKEQKKLYSPKEVTLYNNQAVIDIESMNQNMSEIILSKHLERDFLMIMIPYIQGAITSSKQILQYTQNQEIETIAQHIIHIQEKEIETIQTLLKNIP